ncbi:hypothetical protein GGQ84_001346 [Desulfitispora alkaliphila]
MKHKVEKKQPIGKKCIVCGYDNNFGLKASFYELDNNEIVAIFKPLEEHQSYPGRLHGGISGTMKNCEWWEGLLRIPVDCLRVKGKFF